MGTIQTWISGTFGIGIISISHSWQILNISDCWIPILHQPSTSTPRTNPPHTFTSAKVSKKLGSKDSTTFLKVMSNICLSPPKPNKRWWNSERISQFMIMYLIGVLIVFLSMDQGGYSIWWRLLHLFLHFDVYTSGLHRPGWPITLAGVSTRCCRNFMSSWWLNQPIWKICLLSWIISPK